MYWSRDGIYNLSTNQLGDIVAESVTKKSIQSLYNDIGQLETVSSEGVYDSYEQKVKWIYNNRLDGSGKVVELRSEEHTSELQSLMRISYAVFCLKKKITLTK